MASSKRLTLHDVAAELEVSAKTVSNAYRHPDQLSENLRRRIMAAAARLGYAGPDPVAAGLRGGRIGALGVAYANRLSYAFDDPVTRALLAGLTSTVESAGVGLLLMPGSSDPQLRTASVSRAVVDGIIASSLADDDPLLSVVTARRLPVLVIDQPRPARLAELGATGAPWIGIDDRVAATRAAEHLFALGHRRIGVVSFGLSRGASRGLVGTAVQEAATYAVTRDRLAGYREMAERYGIDWSQVPVTRGTDSTPAEGAAGAAAVLATEPRPTALLCLSDRLAEGALQVAASLGLRVPEDLSVVGFDDAAPQAADLGLTTVHQPSRAKGEQAARILLDRLDDATPLSPIVLDTHLVVRSSTAPPAS